MSTTEDLDIISAAVDRLRAASVPPFPSTRLVKAGEPLQIALDQGGPIVTEDGAIFPGTYTFPSGTNIVFGAGSGIKGTTGQAVIVKPGTRNVQVRGGVFATNHPEKVKIGDSDAELPSDISFSFYRIPKQIGKRAFDVHGDRVSITDGEVEFVTGPNQDSQAIYVAAGTGGLIARNTLRAGAEVVLFGGTAARSANFLTPRDWVIEDNDITRPKEAQTDAVNDLVKNLIEFKNAIGVTVRRNRIHNNWRDTKGGQSGYAILLTPADDGEKRDWLRYSGIVKDITFEDNDIFDVSSAFQVMGRNYASYTAEPLSGIVIRNNRIRVSRAMFADGGLGQFMIISSEVESINIEDNTILSDGSSMLYGYAGKAMLPDGTMRDPGLPFGHLSFKRNIVGFLGSYGFNLLGTANAKEPTWKLAVSDYQLEGNIYNGQSRSGYLGGSFLAGVEFDALPQVAAVKAVQ